MFHRTTGKAYKQHARSRKIQKRANIQWGARNTKHTNDVTKQERQEYEYGDSGNNHLQRGENTETMNNIYMVSFGENMGHDATPVEKQSYFAFAVGDFAPSDVPNEKHSGPRARYGEIRELADTPPGMGLATESSRPPDSTGR